MAVAIWVPVVEPRTRFEPSARVPPATVSVIAETAAEVNEIRASVIVRMFADSVRTVASHG